MNSRPGNFSAHGTVTAAALVLLLALAGCASPGDPSVGTSSRAVDTPAEPAAIAGRAFRVDPEESRLRMRVDPAGPMARLGHVHIIGGNALDGHIIVAPDWRQSALDLSVNVHSLEVDRPEWRDAAGLDEGPDADAVAGTRDNLLGPEVLDAERYPHVRIVGTGLSGPPWMPDATVQIHLRDQVREMTVPVSLEMDQHRLTATGYLELEQQAFGMEPFSAAGGAMRVADVIIVRFRIVAYTDD